MNQGVVTIHRKGLYQFEGQSKVSTGWFKLYGLFFKTKFYTINSEFYKDIFQNNIEDQETELYTMFIVPLDKEFIKT